MTEKPFTYQDALRIQEQGLARWQAVLKPAVFAKLEADVRAATAHIGTENPYSVVRGDDITQWVVAAGYSIENTETVLATWMANKPQRPN